MNYLNHESQITFASSRTLDIGKSRAPGRPDSSTPGVQHSPNARSLSAGTRGERCSGVPPRRFTCELRWFCAAAAAAARSRSAVEARPVVPGRLAVEAGRLRESRSGAAAGGSAGRGDVSPASRL